MRLSKALVVVPLAMTAACGNSPHGSTDDTIVVRSQLSRDTAPVVAPADAAALTAGNTKFAFDLYHHVAVDDSTNLFYSPYSISIALAMTYAGAATTTASEMAAALDFTLPSATLNPAFDSLDLALASRAKGQPGSDGKAFQLNVVDSLWGDQSTTFQPPFLDTLAVNYGAGMHVVDFIDAADAARTQIDGWVSDQTANRIQNLLPEGSVDSDTRLVLVNAIYFNAGWATAFEPTATKPGTFHKLDGSTSMPDMMSNEVDDATFFKGDNYQAVELPYAGGQVSMVLVVPDDGAFSAVEGALDSTFVSSLFSSLSGQAVYITLPKFTVQGATISLKEQLSALGMPDAFKDAADFSAMTDLKPMFISDVLHQAFVKVDESGTEAAAATAVTVATDAAIVETQTVTIDRPFFYLIRDIPTDTVLFVGREVDPS